MPYDKWKAYAMDAEGYDVPLPTDDGWNDLAPGQAPPEFDTREEEARER